MNSTFKVFLSVVCAYLLLIWVLYFVPNLIREIKKQKNERNTKKIIDEDLDRVRKMKEMNAIEKENFKALGSIKVFLSNKSLDDKFLREAVIPEFNKNAPVAEQFSLNLTNRKLRKVIQEKAEEYYTISNPLLEILAESFVAKTIRELGQKKN